MGQSVPVLCVQLLKWSGNFIGQIGKFIRQPTKTMLHLLDELVTKELERLQKGEKKADAEKL